MNLGWTEILLVGGIALLLFGPSKLPGLGRSLGESIRGFKKGLNEDPKDEQEVNPDQISRNHDTPTNKSEVKEEEKTGGKKS